MSKQQFASTESIQMIGERASFDRNRTFENSCFCECIHNKYLFKKKNLQRECFFFFIPLQKEMNKLIKSK